MTRPTPERALWAEKCRRSAQFFLCDSGAVVTKDEHDQVRPVKPFPGDLYERALIDIMCVSGKLLGPDDASYARDAGACRRRAARAGFPHSQVRQDLDQRRLASV